MPRTIRETTATRKAAPANRGGRRSDRRGCCAWIVPGRQLVVEVSVARNSFTPRAEQRDAADALDRAPLNRERALDPVPIDKELRVCPRCSRSRLRQSATIRDEDALPRFQRVERIPPRDAIQRAPLLLPDIQGGGGRGMAQRRWARSVATSHQMAQWTAQGTRWTLKRTAIGGVTELWHLSRAAVSPARDGIGSLHGGRTWADPGGSPVTPCSGDGASGRSLSHRGSIDPAHGAAHRTDLDPGNKPPGPVICPMAEEGGDGLFQRAMARTHDLRLSFHDHTLNAMLLALKIARRQPGATADLLGNHC